YQPRGRGATTTGGPMTIPGPETCGPGNGSITAKHPPRNEPATTTPRIDPIRRFMVVLLCLASAGIDAGWGKNIYTGETGTRATSREFLTMGRVERTV